MIALPVPSFSARAWLQLQTDGGVPMLPHDLTIAVSGGLIL
jgi:hypothetical protein